MLALPPERILFVSDVVEELAACRGAGMQGVLSMRPGNAVVTWSPSITRFEELAVNAYENS